MKKNKKICILIFLSVLYFSFGSSKFSFNILPDKNNLLTEESDSNFRNKIQNYSADLTKVSIGLLIPGGILTGIGLLALVPGSIGIGVYYYILNFYYISSEGKTGLYNYLLISAIVSTAVGGTLFVIGLPILIVGAILKSKKSKVSLFLNSKTDKTELGFAIKI
jgi:hypothetical protein